MEDSRICGCEVCENMLPFDLPKEIIDATIDGNLVIFAGAGISTETKKIFKETLYEDVFLDLELKPGEEIDFPTLMSLYCKTNVNGRQKLLQKIKSRFDYCHQYRELYNQATTFHQELSSIVYIKSVITTNWDDFFEREAGAIPIVIPEDFAFHNLPGRKVYKIHGSISNYGTIIATKEDYDKCYKQLNRGIIGSYLKTILATKTVVFVGYSFRDYDFIRIYNYLKKELKEIIPHCYIVTVNPNISQNLNAQNLTVINTDGTYFLSALRKHLEGSKYLIPKENISNVYYLKELHREIHMETCDLLKDKKLPNLIYCAFYQDGISHALSYLMYHADSGLSFYPQKIFNSIDAYDKLRKEKLKNGNYGDIAYIDGYIEGLHSIFIMEEEELNEFPFWYLYGAEHISDKEAFEECISKNEIFHKKAESYGKKFFKDVLKENAELVFHHRPFL